VTTPCHGLTDLFFPLRGVPPQRIAKALAICAECPYKERCRETAIERNEKDGIWGGTTVSQRRRIRAERLRARQAPLLVA
jgi:hypothetical protein